MCYEDIIHYDPATVVTFEDTVNRLWYENTDARGSNSQNTDTYWV